MKKCLVVLGVIVFALAFVASDLMAYQEAFNVTGHRTQSRNAVVGAVDAAYYNPAGLVALQDGLFVDVGNRILSLTTTNKLVGVPGGTPAGHPGLNKEAESSTMTYLLPNLALVYKSGKAAAFYTLDIRGGGAGGTYESTASRDVLASKYVVGPGWLAGSTLVTKIEGTTYTLGHTLGGAFALNDMVSLSAGMRYLQTMSEKTVSYTAAAGGGSEKEETTLDGYAPFIGVLVTPMQGLNIALQLQGRSILVGEVATTPQTGASYDTSDQSVQPTVLYFGAGYTVMPGLEIMLSYTREFTAEQLYGGDALYDKGDSDKQVFGIGAEYTVAPGIIVSAGLSYKLTGTADENNGDPSDPSFDEMDLGFGGAYTIMPGLSVEVGFAYNIYSEATYQPTGSVALMNHNRNAWVIGIGVTYKAM